MRKEHAGGQPTIGFSWHDDKRIPIPIEVFRPEVTLDSPEDLCREALAEGLPIGPIISELVRAEKAAMGAEILNRVVGLAITARRPDYEIYALALAAGLAVILGITGPMVAKKFGVSKQAVQQKVDSFRDEFCLRKSSAMRDSAARELMRLRNFRRGSAGTATA